MVFTRGSVVSHVVSWRLGCVVVVGAGGLFTFSVTFTVSCATPSAVMRYTTNGSEPVSSSPVVGPAGVLWDTFGTFDMQARAFVDGMAPSPIGAQRFVVQDRAALPAAYPSGAT